MVTYWRLASVLVIVLIGAGVALPAALAQQPSENPRPGALTVSGAWARTTPPNARTGAAYLSISNPGGEPDRLIAAASPAASQAELHTHVMEGGVARMRQLQAIDVPAGGRVEFAPGGLHVMLIDLKGPLRDGTHFPLTLRFARAGEVTIEVPISRNAPPGTGSHRH